MTDDAESEKQGRDRRKYARTPVLWAGAIVFGDRAVDCVVMNASANGAKVRVSEVADFPTSVILRIPRLGSFRAEVVWARDNRLGVRFLEKPAKVARLMGQALPQSRAAL